MCACTSLIHCFIEEVFRKTYKMSSFQFLNFRGYNSLSILTSGSHLTNTDLFYNTIHTDVKNCLDKVFQQNAIKLLNEPKGRSRISPKSCKGIEYLEALSTCCNGFSASTTCGYTILENGGDDCKNIGFNANFALVGLGILVRIHSNDFYHTFFASAVTHCTSLPVTPLHGTVCSIFTGHFNIVAWGVGSAKAKKVYDRHFEEENINHGSRMKTVTRKALIAWLLHTYIPAEIYDADELNIDVT